MNAGSHAALKSAAKTINGESLRGDRERSQNAIAGGTDENVEGERCGAISDGTRAYINKTVNSLWALFALVRI
jgi:hypothetical protein